MAVTPYSLRLIYNFVEPHNTRWYVWQRQKDGLIAYTPYRVRQDTRIIVVTDSEEIAIRVAARARKELPPGPQTDRARRRQQAEPKGWERPAPTEAQRRTARVERNESIRAVSGGLPTLGKRR